MRLRRLAYTPLASQRDAMFCIDDVFSAVGKVAGFDSISRESLSFCDYVFGFTQGDSRSLYMSEMSPALSAQLIEHHQKCVFPNMEQWLKLAKQVIDVLLSPTPPVYFNSAWSKYEITRPMFLFDSEYRITGTTQRRYSLQHADFISLVSSLYAKSKGKTCESASKSSKTGDQVFGHSLQSPPNKGYYAIRPDATGNVPYGIAITGSASDELSRTSWVVVNNPSTLNFDARGLYIPWENL